MNPAKWDAIAESFERGELVPANGMTAWRDQARDDAIRISEILPDEVDVLVEIGCGVGRLTPYLAIMFPRVIAVDTSAQCRRLTMIATAYSKGVVVCAPDEVPSIGQPDAAVVWGNLYDEDWSAAAALSHLLDLHARHNYVLCQARPTLRLAFEGSLWATHGDDWLLLTQS